MCRRQAEESRHPGMDLLRKTKDLSNDFLPQASIKNRPFSYIIKYVMM